MKEREVLFIKGKLGSGDNSEQKQHITTQRISIFESDHPYSSMSMLHTGDLILMLLAQR